MGIMLFKRRRAADSGSMHEAPRCCNCCVNSNCTERQAVQPGQAAPGEVKMGMVLDRIFHLADIQVLKAAAAALGKPCT
jgi:hypothetical protein